jgi:uncharacterized GH25 family protein
MLNKRDQQLLLADWSFMSKEQIKDKYQITGIELDRIIKKHKRRGKQSKPLTQEQKYYILDNPGLSMSELARQLKNTYSRVARVRKSKLDTL